MVVGCTFAAVCLTLLVLLMLQPTYQLSASFRPVGPATFSELNVSGILKCSPDAAIRVFRTNLESRQLRKWFFSQEEYQQGFYDEPVESTFEQQFAEFS